MGHLFLNEPFTPRELTSAFTSFAGVLFITKPHALFGGKDEDFLVSEKGQTLGAGWGIGEAKFAVGLGLLGVASASAACESAPLSSFGPSIRLLRMGQLTLAVGHSPL